MKNKYNIPDLLEAENTIFANNKLLLLKEKQLKELVEDQKINCEVMGLKDLLYLAIIFPENMKIKKTEQSKIMAEEE